MSKWKIFCKTFWMWHEIHKEKQRELRKQGKAHIVVFDENGKDYILSDCE